ncbi:tripartite tricarboxylate transporter substrate binding protein [Polynucleobacter sp. AP-Latsch-80-C2]|jgi:tripartite-type tricarboxylate transporter receptor subunit TctC|uniref:Bug family tripartite tricarboxylate transporter substrate binding protein n=1 Tax=Polynucleobacter sp. AP-Latsch-80-C2 TaxID=2576931 RepID=UPI001C0BBB63|nr:tripartite tricarboxylate transporter substrate binding protein [Polynucleobacter sp. AP-Latsch-80-C2]MBU3623431.1 tripartite tricarboxylate transporter substrate binding protein [Polynucleobacter sp. AP-Latsch-80-C2]
MRLRHYCISLAVLFTGLISFSATAQSSYPNRPIRLIIPFTPGGVTDTSGRFIAEQLSLKLGQQVIADNRPGASGNIGTQMVATAEPDGYTLLLGYAGTLSINPSLFDKVPFDSLKDFAPIGKIGDAVLILVANNDFAGKNWAEVIAISKKDPNGLSYGTSGSGGTPHIAGELLRQKTGANLVHVPYKGGGQALIDLLGGNIPLVYTAVAGANQYVKSGRVKAIAVSSAKRSPSLPDVPTFIESGVKDFEIDDWVGLLAPAKTPKPIVMKLNQALNEILNSPEGKAKLLGMGITPTPGTPEKFGEQIKSDLLRFSPIVKGMQIKSE